MKKIVILGASGSIGTTALNILRNHNDSFELVAFSVYNQTNLIEPILKEFKKVTMVSVKKLDEIQNLILKYPNIIFVEKEEGLSQLAQVKCDIIINALVGFVGLLPTLKAIENKTNVALANKETLVAAGELVMKAAKENNVKIIPIDSEHSAIFQCLEKENQVKKIILTASGGPFYNKDKADIYDASVEEALNHPNWKMGKKITIDSATMFNKAFEIIEARWLFDLKSEQIETIIHPQSLVHSLVEFNDGSLKAQMGVSDMAIPIGYALTYPQRFSSIATSLNLANKHLDFYPMDSNKFKAIDLAYEVLKKGLTYPTVLNGANEEAVKRFLNHEIKFGQIEEIVMTTLKAHQPHMKELSIEEVVNAHNWAINYARRINI